MSAASRKVASRPAGSGRNSYIYSRWWSSCWRRLRAFSEGGRTVAAGRPPARLACLPTERRALIVSERMLRSVAALGSRGVFAGRADELAVLEPAATRCGQPQVVLVERGGWRRQVHPAGSRRKSLTSTTRSRSVPMRAARAADTTPSPRATRVSLMSRASGTERASRSSLGSTRVSPARTAARAWSRPGRARLVPVSPLSR